MRLVDYGVDYVTLTRLEPRLLSEEDTGVIRASFIRDYLCGQSGTELVKWMWNGYVGWRYGSIAHGARHDGSIFRVSGGCARLVFGWPLGDEWRATRLDLQATVSDLGQEPDGWIELMADKAIRGRAGKTGRPWRIALMLGYGAGNTLYVGSRASELMLRLYNKDQESGNDVEYAGAIRAEVELKGPTAARTFRHLRGSQNPAAVALGLVVATYTARGIDDMAGLDQTNAAPLAVVAKLTDVESRLLWLEKSVRGVVRRLTDAGYDADVLQALGVEASPGRLTVAREPVTLGGRDLV